MTRTPCSFHRRQHHPRTLVVVLILLQLLVFTPPEAVLASEEDEQATAGSVGDSPVGGDGDDLRRPPVVTFLKDTVITIGDGVSTTGGGCVASRSLKDGAWQWRSAGCDVDSESITTTTQSRASRLLVVNVVDEDETTVVTLDRDEMVLRGWQATSGVPMFDVRIPREDDHDQYHGNDVKLYPVDSDRVAVVTGDVVSVRSVVDGVALWSLSAAEELVRAGVVPYYMETNAATPTTARVLGVSTREEVLVGWTFFLPQHKSGTIRLSRLTGLALCSSHEDREGDDNENEVVVAKEVEVSVGVNSLMEVSSIALYDHLHWGLSAVIKKVGEQNDHSLMDFSGLLKQSSRTNYYHLPSLQTRYTVYNNIIVVISTDDEDVESKDDESEENYPFATGTFNLAANTNNYEKFSDSLLVTATADFTILLMKKKDDEVHRLVFMDIFLTTTLKTLALPKMTTQLSNDFVVGMSCDDASSMALLTTNRGTSFLWDIRDDRIATLRWTSPGETTTTCVDASGEEGTAGGTCSS